MRSINARLKALREKNPRNPYGFTRLQRLALLLANTAFWVSLAASVVLVVRAILKL